MKRILGYYTYHAKVFDFNKRTRVPIYVLTQELQTYIKDECDDDIRFVNVTFNQWYLFISLDNGDRVDILLNR